MLPSRPIIIVMTRVEIGLERDDLEVEHQVDVVGVEHRDAGRLVDAGREVRSGPSRPVSMRCSISRTDDRYSSSLRRSVGAEICRSASTCARATRSRMLRRYCSRRARASGRGSVSMSPNSRSKTSAGIRLRGHRRGRPAPGEAVRVGAANSRNRSCRPCASRRSRARARRSASGRPRCCRGDLVDRDAVLDVGARRLARVDAGQVRGARARVVAGAVAERVRRSCARGPRGRACRRGTARAASGCA